MRYTVRGILQARILEWVALPSPRDLSNPGIKPRSPSLQEDSLPAEQPGKPRNTGVGSVSLLYQIFPTQESSWGLLHCRQILYQLNYQFSSVTQSCPTLRPHGLWQAKPPCLSPTPGVNSNSCPLSQWCHPIISSSVIPFSSSLQSFSASGSFPMSQLFASGGQSIGASASTSVLPVNIQDWFPLEWTGWTSLLSKGLSRVFSNTTVQKHHFFSAQLSSQSNSHIHTWPLEKP